jgi:hypothetical protein
MAPIHLQPLLEIYCFPMAKDCPHMAHAPMAVDTLIELGLVEHRAFDGEAQEGHHTLRITDKGRAFVMAVLETPLPEQRWIVPR